jgi:DNA-binding CsgD family transcriptional regulator
MRIVDSDARRLLDCLRMLYQCDDLRTFRTRLIHALRGLVQCEFVSFAEIDPTVRVAHGFADPAIPFDSWAALGRHVLEHPIARHYRHTRDLTAFRLSDFVTLRQLRSGALYSEVLKPIGVDRQIAFGFELHPPRVVGIAYSRRGRDFSEQERLLLNLLRPHAAEAYRAADAHALLWTGIATRRREGSPSRATAFVHPGDRLEIVHERALRSSERDFGAVRGRVVLPEPLNRRLLHHSAKPKPSGSHVDCPTAPPRLRQEEDDVVIEIATGRSDPPCTLIVHERMTRQHTSAGTLGLTSREREVLTWVANGKTNAETATILKVSGRTVQKHLEHIFDKLGVDNRTAAAACLRALAP